MSMAFPAKSVRFGRFEVLPMQNIELSEVQLRIVFRVNEQSSHDDSVSFELHPAEFGKTVYTFDETTTKMLFFVHHHHFDCIKYDVKRLLEQFNQAGEGTNAHTIILIVGFRYFYLVLHNCCLWSQEKLEMPIVGS